MFIARNRIFVVWAKTRQTNQKKYKQTHFENQNRVQYLSFTFFVLTLCCLLLLYQGILTVPYFWRYVVWSLATEHLFAAARRTLIDGNWQSFL